MSTQASLEGGSRSVEPKVPRHGYVQVEGGLGPGELPEVGALEDKPFWSHTHKLLT